MIEHAPHIHEPETSEEFEDWIQDFPKGYVINRVSSTNARMHQGHCGHFKGNKPGTNLIKGRKVLSRDEATLRGWWAGHPGEARPKDCHCMRSG